MTRPDIPTLPNEILERIVKTSIETDPETAFKTALAFPKQMCALSQKGKYSTIYKAIIPRMPYKGGMVLVSLYKMLVIEDWYALWNGGYVMD